MTDFNTYAVQEICRLLDEAYDHYFANSDGHCKMSEGHVTVNQSYGNYWDRKEGQNQPIQSVTVYSYVLGPHRSHDFESLEEALETVQRWHASEMSHDYQADEEAFIAYWNERTVG